MANTDADKPLFPCTSNQWNDFLQEFMTLFAAEGRWVLHGLRRAGALRMQCMGFGVEAIIDQGRWAGTAVQRGCIQVLAARIRDSAFGNTLLPVLELQTCSRQ